MARQIFEGVKAVDFGWVGVGPVASQYLAGHGATVVRVESTLRPETLRLQGPFKDGIPGINRSVFFTGANADKFGVTLNLEHPRGKDVALRLVKWANVVTSGYSPGVMEKWGLSYEECRKVKPDIIVLNTCMQGQTGPHRQYRGYGTQMGALSGFYYVTGWPDREPTLVFGAYADFINLRYTALLLMATLDYRRRTGKGQYIDQSQFEGALQFFAPPILDYVVNGRVMERMGNRDPYAVPHGAYPCRGVDRWCTISVSNDAEWSGFCEVIGNPDWTREPRFSTFLARKENENDLDNLVSEWTRTYTAEQVMTMMQDKGIPAGVVQTSEDVLNDPQLKHRPHYVTMKHTEIGPHLYQTRPYKLSKTPGGHIRPAPCIGEHNEFVYKQLLGMTDEEIADLTAEGVLT